MNNKNMKSLLCVIIKTNMIHPPPLFTHTLYATPQLIEKPVNECTYRIVSLTIFVVAGVPCNIFIASDSDFYTFSIRILFLFSSFPYSRVCVWLRVCVVCNMHI